MTDISETLDERALTHGDFTAVAIQAQKIKTTFPPSLPAAQNEALDLIATKIARICNGDNLEPDHWLDIEGYARLISERLKK
jgi:hypothetical protein